MKKIKKNSVKKKTAQKKSVKKKTAQKKSKPVRITSTNILNHVTNEKRPGVRIAKTSLRLFARMARS